MENETINIENQIKFLENRIKVLMTIYKAEYQNYKKSPNVGKDQENLEHMPILEVYEKEKESLNILIKKFVVLLKKFEDYKGEPNLEREMLNEKNSFENEFVALNSDIQQIRSDNETLYDEIKKKEMKLKKLIKEVEDKDSLIALLQKNIKANEEK
jgi:hypothetical protein